VTAGKSTQTVDAWARYRRLLLVVTTMVPFAIGAAYLFLYLAGTPLRLHLLVSLALGITLSMLLAGALMGLLFLSSRSGVDASVADDPLDEDDP
jgi:hypothetical protein